MAKDPAFLFYPGDYLTDTQCLSENVQVAYDRIMCEHMRNICISQQQLKFFTKKLSTDEVEELKMVLTETDGGFQISWVAESIVKRKAYSQSRRENRGKKNEEKPNNISETYDKHMENENENEIKDKIKKGKGGTGEKPPKEILLIPDEFKPIWKEWLDYRKAKKKSNYAALKYEQIAANKFIELSNNNTETGKKIILQTIQNNWEGLFELKSDKNGTTQPKSITEINCGVANSEAARNFVESRRPAKG